MKIIGLTGRMCSGKSTIANFFQVLGCSIIVADRLAKWVLKEKEILLEIKKKFGEEVFENEKISFSKLAEKSFANKKNVELLNSITHPRIAKIFSASIQDLKKNNDSQIVIYDAPLLIESGAYKSVDKTILVVTDELVIEERWRKKLAKQNTPFQISDLKTRLQYQIQPAAAKKMADFIIDGNQNLQGVKEQTLAIYQKLIA
jgi:dephospho-CoA kinase